MLEVVGILVDRVGIPVDLVVFLVHGGPDHGRIDLGLVQNEMEGMGGDGPEFGSPDAWDLTDDGGVVVLATDDQLGLFADLLDFRPVQGKFLLERIELCVALLGFACRCLGDVFILGLGHLFLLAALRSRNLPTWVLRKLRYLW